MPNLDPTTLLLQLGILLAVAFLLGRLAETTQPHPGLVGVDTIRLTDVEQTTDRLLAVAGFKWNIADTWLLTANVRRPLTSVGLNAGWVPTITFDYSFDQ